MEGEGLHTTYKSTWGGNIEKNPPININKAGWNLSIFLFSIGNASSFIQGPFSRQLCWLIPECIEPML